MCTTQRNDGFQPIDINAQPSNVNAQPSNVNANPVM